MLYMKYSAMEKSKLLLHACCAPCSSYVLELLNQEYDITVFFYNPNITEKLEYKKRYEELLRLIKEAPFSIDVIAIDGGFDAESFFLMSKGMEEYPERSARCYKCYQMRMEATAKYASDNGYDIFTTTLSISPHKNATWINEIGALCEEKYGVTYMYSDFKKKNGYARSIQLSKEYDLYRQDYCGCIYSKREKENKNNNSLV
ncbi:MAG: epoxyqueuosine reductase QueH [Lachnospiraceae bacterium]|nr:epoxyqueuosine reductase QueH [Lachnospiraceae bacterium]MBQ9934482.1 epoxyqueuosine reductase QueH [Lachnospiraceae bacterium]